MTKDEQKELARSICAEQADKQDPEYGDKYRSGEWDHTVWMRLVEEGVSRTIACVEALSAENKRLREQLSGISGRLNVMREALIHTAGICNPASGFLKNATGVRKKHIENACDIALAALGDRK